MRSPKLSRRVVILVIVSLALFSIILRYPRIEHETGVDSFVHHGITQSLYEDGYAKWALNPLSYFGLYPLSHPAGPHFLLAGFSLTSGIPVEGTILLLDLLVAILGMLGAFLVAREIRRDDFFAIMVALVFTLAPRFVSNLQWEMPTRTFFTAMTPFFLLGLLRAHRSANLKGLFAFVVAPFIIMMASHRLTVLMLLVVIAYVAAFIVFTIVQILRLRFSRVLLARRVVRLGRVGLAAAVFLIAAYFIVGTGLLDQYQKGRLATSDDVVFQMFNLGVSLSRSMGLHLPFLLVGAVMLLRGRLQNFYGLFLLIMLLALLPTLSLRQYTGFYIIPFAAVFIGWGLVAVVSFLRQRALVAFAVFAALLVGGYAFTAYVVDYDIAASPPGPRNETYNAALWVDTHVDQTLIANSGLLGSRVNAYSGKAYLPIGGATTPFQGPDLLTFDFVNPRNLHIIQIPLQELTVESDSPFVLLTVNAEVDWVTILSEYLENAPEGLMNRYRVGYALEDHRLGANLEAYGKVYESRFVLSLSWYRYRTYDDGVQSIWFVGSPQAP